jgi:tRNA(Ile)-lysidine synthetase-like protein
MSNHAAGRLVTAAHVDAALGLLAAAEDASVDIPGGRVHRIGGRIVLDERGSSGSGHLNPMNYWRFPLSIPGEVTSQHMALSAEVVSDGAIGLERSANVGRGVVAAVRADLVLAAAENGLAVRNRRPGDRFQPVGLAGRKKLQDVFVDCKIARTERDRVPIVVDDRDRIVWVAGHGIDAAFRVTDASQGVVVLRLKYLER